MTLKGKWRGGVWIPAHKDYKVMTKKELQEERVRCFREKRYYQTLARSYGAKLAFLDKLLGLTPESNGEVERALKDFEEKEGKLVE